MSPQRPRPLIGHVVRRRFDIARFDDHEFVIGPAAMLVADIVSTQFEQPEFIDRITEVNDDEGTARDVTEDVAIAVARYCGRHDIREVERGVYDFIETHACSGYARGLKIIDRTMSAA